MNEEETQKAREKQSHLYELVAVLDRFKKEKEVALYTEKKTNRMDVDFSMLESKAADAQKELDKMIEEWQWKFVTSEEIWSFFGPKPESRFDPTLIIDKYVEDSTTSLKKKKAVLAPEKLASEEALSSAGLNAKKPCDSLMSSDIPTFLTLTKDLAEKMGFKIINQSIKTDAMASGEGQASDMLCVEKFQSSSRVLFCVRRWREPIGYLSLMNMVGALKTYQANRLVLISTSELSSEAKRAIDGNSSIDFYTCEDVISYLG